jgi:hypothetical protein
LPKTLLLLASPLKGMQIRRSNRSKLYTKFTALKFKQAQQTNSNEVWISYEEMSQMLRKKDFRTPLIIKMHDIKFNKYQSVLIYKFTATRKTLKKNYAEDEKGTRTFVL